LCFTFPSFDGAGRRLGPPGGLGLQIPALALQIDVPFPVFVGVNFDGMAFVAPMNSYGEFAIKGNFHFRIIFDVPFHFCNLRLFCAASLTATYYTTVT